ncbi:hypothetical protein BM536_005440 [Streptomyces phaeoluteigriseus]|uniref:Uncharacterized protein n=1 Tax=Streptomyces phaeoluteigriseus TaxID=114686 RepID=A0A1V6MYL6_9ACTN|nr:hypothetical protein [Streptomyces phaeoluteigriseus]OQD57396.1 hypothetical protein BM536_005440 [Streptomyces phaeoluteigriseus]
MSHGTGADIDELLTMSRPELERLFRASHPGEIPRGEGRGTVLTARGAKTSKAVAALARLLAWQGKVVDPDRGELRNRVTPFGIRAIRAKVYRGESLLDGGECIVLDYSRTSFVAHWIRDEIRQVGPYRYLGIVYWGRRRILNFSLYFAGAHT